MRGQFRRNIFAKVARLVNNWFGFFGADSATTGPPPSDDQPGPALCGHSTIRLSDYSTLATCGLPTCAIGLAGVSTHAAALAVLVSPPLPIRRLRTIRNGKATVPQRSLFGAAAHGMTLATVRATEPTMEKLFDESV
jgi:hypothetical protein